MFKKFFAALAALLLAGAAFAAVDANKASQAELESIKGIGPVISTLIISERKKGDFKNWEDLVVRVKGVGEKSAAKFSQDGLTVNGAAYAGAPAVAKTEKTEKTPVTEKAASAASRAGSAVKTGAEKAASATKGAAVAVKDKAVETKDAVKDKAAEKKAERAEKKAEKAEKAEKKAEAASAASAPKKK